jgi:hypothetical protein
MYILHFVTHTPPVTTKFQEISPKYFKFLSFRGCFRADNARPILGRFAGKFWQNFWDESQKKKKKYLCRTEIRYPNILLVISDVR